MRHALKFIVALLVLPTVALAAADGTEAGPGPFPAAEVALESQQYRSRALVVFADSAESPQFQRQLHLLEAGLADLAERDVIVILDTEPETPSEWRLRLRPRGFSLVQLDKDFTPVFRKPAPWDVREITRAIDKLPSRRQEVLERFPGR